MKALIAASIFLFMASRADAQTASGSIYKTSKRAEAPAANCVKIADENGSHFKCAPIGSDAAQDAEVVSGSYKNDTAPRSGYYSNAKAKQNSPRRMQSRGTASAR